MRQGLKRRRNASAGVLFATSLAMLALTPSAFAAGPPVLGDSWASTVFSTTARLHAEVNPNGLFSTYRFEYITKAAHDANVAASKDPFAGASRAPSQTDASIGSGTASVTVLQFVSALTPDTTYRYRVVAKNSGGTASGPTQAFATFPLSGGPLLPDERGWEMVSPIEKNGGQVDPPGTLAGGGLIAAAAAGDAITYSSAASFGQAIGAPPASQYVARRGGGGWTSENLDVAIFSGSYDVETEGVPYRLFSHDLTRGLLTSGKRCRGEAAEGCPVANPPLPGTDAPAGYRNYYLREAGGFQSLLGASDIAFTNVDPADFDLTMAGATRDLSAIVLASCAALTQNATEAPQGEACDHAQPNLYRWSGGGLSLVNLLPAQSVGTPGGALAAPTGAISADGARIYWRSLTSGNLYLREAGATKQVDADAGGGGSFQAAAADGSVAYFTKDGHLWRFLAGADAATDLTPVGGVVGVLEASAAGDRVYFQDSDGLKVWRAGQTSTIAPGPEIAHAANFPPATGTARVSADGARLLFVSDESLTGYDNTDLDTKAPDRQVFLYDDGPKALICVSCNASGARPAGPSTIPATRANGSVAGSPPYKPRVLALEGRRVFFESEDALVIGDTNNVSDVYQWEAQGTGSCTRPGGCVALISSGRDAAGAIFADASAEGADAYFLTEESLVASDLGSLDLYDARVGGGFPVPSPPIPCTGDSCQALPPEPADPTLTTLLAGPGNPSVRYRRYGRKAKKTCPRGTRPKVVGKGKNKVTRCVKARRETKGGRRR
jgi:hypothetical protein